MFKGLKLVDRVRGPKLGDKPDKPPTKTWLKKLRQKANQLRREYPLPLCSPCAQKETANDEPKTVAP